MNQTLIKGALIGGVVLFVWTMISWELLPWHTAGFTSFRDEGAVAQVVSANVSGPGLYGIPGMAKTAGLSPADQKAAEAAMIKRMQEGPIVFMAVRPQGMSSMVKPMVVELVTVVLGALLLTWLLQRSSARTHSARAQFAVVACLMAGILTALPEWNWWGFSTMYSLVGIADLMVGGLFAGLAISRFAFPRTA